MTELKNSASFEQKIEKKIEDSIAQKLTKKIEDKITNKLLGPAQDTNNSSKNREEETRTKR